ncbi:MAG: NAD(P)/FAD-dependent oxidoreductase, partial [Thermoanaerobacterales bacterium]|nr:NAD(P)/FAD-dependent oxidoreductase [Thermoanaerobacterales bacterium]
TGARAVRANDGDGEIIMISEEKHLPYSKVLLTYYVSGEVEQNDMYLTTKSEYDGLGIKVFWGNKVTRLDTHNKQLFLDNSINIDYDSLLIASGGSPILPEPLKKGINGVTGLRTIEDAYFLRRAAVNKEKCVISGGGMIGVKLACALKEMGADVQIIIKSPRILSKVADEETSFLIQRHMEANDVKIRTGSNVAETVAENSRLSSVILDSGEVIDCKVYAVCKGVKPNLEFLVNKSGLERGIKVNEKMMTDFYDVYAAGDVASTFDILQRYNTNTAIWPHAVEQAKIAGSNMAGENLVFRGSVSRNSLSIFGLPMITIGITNPDFNKEDWDFSIINDSNSYQKLIYRKGKLAGAILLGNIDRAGILQAEIRKNAIQ